MIDQIRSHPPRSLTRYAPSSFDLEHTFLIEQEVSDRLGKTYLGEGRIKWPVERLNRHSHATLDPRILNLSDSRPKGKYVSRRAVCRWRSCMRPSASGGTPVG